MNLDELKADAALRQQIEIDEGKRSTPYKDTCGNWTAGIGHNLVAHGMAAQVAGWLRTGIPEATILEWFEEDVGAAITCCSHVFDDFETLPDEAQRVLVNMAFDLMYKLWDWPLLRAAVAEDKWLAAADSIMHSHFAVQAPKRCLRLADRLRALS